MGGSERQYSVSNALKHVPEDTDIVMVHDAARCFVTERIIRDCAASAIRCGSGVAGIGATDTIKRAKDGVIIETIPRGELAIIQTPQAFVPEIIKAALTRAIAEKKEYTDDCAAVEAMGVKVHLSKGSPENIKITGPVDIPTAAAILKTRGE